MQYNLKGTGVVVTPEVRAYVEKRLAHPGKFLAKDPTTHADVEVEYSAMRDGPKYRAEFTIEASGSVYRAEEWGTTLHEALDLAVAQITKKIRRSKHKHLHLFRRGALRIKEYLRGLRDRF